VIVGIDASSVRSGGGVSYLAGVLRAATPGRQGIESIRVWAKRSTLALLPERDWLDLVEAPLLERSLPMRVFWQRSILPRLARSCDDVIAPGGTAPYDLDPLVTMSQNMLPFDPEEARRFGHGWVALRLRILRRTQEKSFRRSQGVIFLSKYARDRIGRALGGVPNAITIPHGVSEEFRREPRPARVIGDCTAGDPFRLIYVSIVDVYKHQWVVAEAVARLRALGLPVEIDFLGPAFPPALARLREVLDKLDPGAEFLRYSGEVPHRDLPERLFGADLFVFASSCENLPNIVIEAMAAGLPIASSRRPPMPEVLEDAGAYFDPEDVSDIERTLEELIRDADRRKSLAQRAWRKSQGYSWKRCADETLAFLAATARAGPA
jgi:glycosyltransferase involved in cell wall biosynthesis